MSRLLTLMFLADLKAIKTTYNNQGIRDFVFSADYVNNSFNIRELSGVFQGKHRLVFRAIF